MDEKEKEPATEGKKKITMFVNPGGEINGSSRYFTFRSIREKDVSAVHSIISECEFKEGFPDSPRRISALIHALIDRQEKTPYGGLVIQEGESLVAALAFGYMDVLEPEKLKAKDIVDAYEELGVIRFKDPDAEDKYAEGNIERVHIDIEDLGSIWQQASLTPPKMDKLIDTKKGLGTILPMIPESLGDCDLHLMLEDSLPETLKIENAPAIIKLKDGKYNLIVKKGKNVERVSLPEEMKVDSLGAFFQKNLAQGKVFMSWDDPIMKDIILKGGHTSLWHEKIKDVLGIGVKVCQVLKNAGHLLPVEETVPTHVIGLFHPEDPLIAPLKDVGFQILESEDFKIYYNAQPRIMAYYEL